MSVAGYMPIPQGRLHVHNPTGRQVDPDDPKGAGFENVALQRTVELVTRTAGESVTSTMHMEINANGADMSITSWVIQSPMSAAGTPRL